MRRREAGSSFRRFPERAAGTHHNRSRHGMVATGGAGAHWHRGGDRAYDDVGHTKVRAKRVAGIEQLKVQANGLITTIRSINLG